MVQITIFLASEIATVLNFVFIDIILLSYVMHVSGLLAGHANHLILNRHQALNLVPFNAPVVGGGLVTERGYRRNLLIMLRLSVVLAAALCNFGLEGRSRIGYVEKDALLRSPGPLLNDTGQPPDYKDMVDVLTNVTGMRMHCFDQINRELKYGAVLNGVCYRGLDEHVFIKSSKIDGTEVSARTTECVETIDCSAYRTIFRCKQADLVCLGIDFQKCPEEDGIYSSFDPDNCYGVLYSKDGNNSWICERKQLMPNTEEGKGFCKFVDAKRENIKNWIDYYHVETLDLETALFTAAYGMPRIEKVKVPDDEVAVTVMNLFWFVPVSWVITVSIVVSVWRWMHVVRKTPIVAHDEFGLTRLLDRQIEGKYYNSGGEIRKRGWREREIDECGI